MHIVKRIGIVKNVSQDAVSRKVNTKTIKVVRFLGYKVVAQVRLFRRQQRLSDFNKFSKFSIFIMIDSVNHLVALATGRNFVLSLSSDLDLQDSI